MSCLVIFDVDGTLLETDRVTVPAVQQTFARHGLAVPDAADICRFFGRPVEEYHAWLAKQCPEGMAKEIIRETDKRELELIGEQGRLYPGVREMLTTLRSKGCPLAISSNGPEDYVREFVRAHNVGPFFDEVRTPDNSLRTKVDMVRDIMTLIAARTSIVVGDRQDDVRSAHANGALAIGVTYGFSGPHELEHADATVTCAAEIPAAIERLRRLHNNNA